MNEIFYGESKCEGSNLKTCRFNAYWVVSELESAKITKKYLCGVHSKKYAHKRKKLRVNPNKKENEELAQTVHSESVEKTALENKNEGIRGDIKVTKAGMMKKREPTHSYLSVHPNFKDLKRYGYCAPELSPKSPFEVIHHQPGLENCKNIENYHQGNKVFECEYDKAKDEPNQLFYQNQTKFYSDNEPHRHKYKSTKENKNIPLFSVHKDKEGIQHRYRYSQSRFFYCHQYELMVKNHPKYLELKGKLELGYNLEIFGYDGYPIENDIDYYYQSEKKPFGHELVLYTMLKESNEQNYPWNKFKLQCLCH